MRRAIKSLVFCFLVCCLVLIATDVVLIALGLFPPRVRAGDPELGWAPARPEGAILEQTCTEFSSGTRHRFVRNEDGIRTDHGREDLLADDGAFVIVVGGDSHTEVCSSNRQAHFGVLEREMSRAGYLAKVAANGAGKYSPLQAYLALRRPVRDYDANAVVLNLYTGNDVYDLLRFDDRPHFEPDLLGYHVAAPTWYLEDPPGTVRRSRVAWAFRLLADATGLRGAAVRLWYLRDTAREQHASVLRVLKYLNDLRRSTSGEIGYPAALSAQMLNQQLFFRHFPDGRQEGIRRLRALMELVRREQPGRMLVLSPIPSYQLVAGERVNPAMARVLGRLSITKGEGVALEQGLYDEAAMLADELGWVFVDTLPRLRAEAVPDSLYNSFDYHVSPAASDIIGRAQAEAITSRLDSTWYATSRHDARPTSHNREP